ncbi:MAG: D-alanine--D-alanine ligase [Ghiorsea sp.]|nr:D-alanine--D-alanine ligase [Ghiorsea sp.]
MNMQLLEGKRIVVLMGGASAEREISLRSGVAVAQSLLKQGLEVVALDLPEHTKAWFELIQAAQADIAFITLHGTYGEDGCIQGLLDIMQLPYTGSGVSASALCMNKKLTKCVLDDMGICTPGDVLIRNGKPQHYPVFVKPVAEGSSVGLHYIEDEIAWDTLCLEDLSGWLIEPCVRGIEVAVSVVDGKALPAVEVKPKSGVYDFASKYTAGATDYYCPARLSSSQSNQCKSIAEQAVKATGCVGAPRVDLIVPDIGEVVVLEINTIPGMTATSLLPKAAAELGVSFEDLCVNILMSASCGGVK